MIVPSCSDPDPSSSESSRRPDLSTSFQLRPAQMVIMREELSISTQNPLRWNKQNANQRPVKDSRLRGEDTCTDITLCALLTGTTAHPMACFLKNITCKLSDRFFKTVQCRIFQGHQGDSGSKCSQEPLEHFYLYDLFTLKRADLFKKICQGSGFLCGRTLVLYF